MTNPDRPHSDGPATDLERRLLGWTPAPAPAGRDRMLFEAGVAAGRRRASIQAAGLLAALSLGLGGWIGAERSARTRLEVALAEQARAPELARDHPPAPPNPVRDRPIPRAPASYLALGRRGAGDPTEPIAGPPGVNLFPSGGGPVFTPLSARQLGDAVEL